MDRIALRHVAVALLIVVGVATAPAHAADGRSTGAVQAWLSGVAQSLAADGYRLRWETVAPAPSGGVAVGGLRGTDATGSERLRIGRLTLIDPRTGDSGKTRASRLVAEDVSVSGSRGYSIRRITIDRPDLAAIGAELRDQVAQPPSDRRPPWTEHLNVERLEIVDFASGAPNDGRPEQVSFDRLLLVDGRPGRIQQLEIDGVRKISQDRSGERLEMTAAGVRAADIRIEPHVYAMADDPENLRPLQALAGFRVGRFDVSGFRASSTRTGTSEADRLWIRTKTYVAGESGVMEFGSDSARSRPAGEPGPLSPFLAELFPPDGEVPVDWSCDLAYDAADGFVGVRQHFGIDGFGAFDFRVDVGGLPDLTVGEWRSVAKGDPRLKGTQINGLAVSITDAGGGDRVVLAMSEDKSKPPRALRDQLAAQVAAIAASFDPKADPRLAAWIGVIEEFVRLGGTLALAVTRPIPVGAAAEEAERTGDFTALADRYGLTVSRR